MVDTSYKSNERRKGKKAMFNLHWWENLVMSQARVMREDVVAQNREIIDGAAVGKQEKELGELKLVLGEHENGFSFGAFLQGFARLSSPPFFYFCSPFL